MNYIAEINYAQNEIPTVFTAVDVAAYPVAWHAIELTYCCSLSLAISRGTALGIFSVVYFIRGGCQKVRVYGVDE